MDEANSTGAGISWYKWGDSAHITVTVNGRLSPLYTCSPDSFHTLTAVPVSIM